MSRSPSDAKPSYLVEEIEVTRLIPYWRNPRKNDKAVEKVAESIRQFGFQQPILVDAGMVIVAGHTRYAAARSLGMERVPVVVTDLTGEQATAYRVIDNRTSEYAVWDTDTLMLELKTFSDPTLLDLFFPHIDLTTDFADAPAPVTQEQVDAASGRIEDGYKGLSDSRANTQTLTISCPHCFGDVILNRGDLDQSRWTNGEE
jgi:hypothetical protein